MDRVRLRRAEDASSSESLRKGDRRVSQIEVSEGMGFVPVIIVGAPRSGTNLLRDLLTSHPDATTWPCDEINYIWRYGNRAHPSDELPRTAATDRVRRFIRGHFSRIADEESTHVIEKTCANALRVPFVNVILPEARYIHIVRDGRDAVLSIMKRWTGSVELGYLLRKARFVPPADVPFYAWRFLWSRISRFTRGDRAVASWGPRFSGIDEMVRTRPLAEVCAEQWRRCVQRAADALEQLPPNRVSRVRYESLVASPAVEMDRIGREIGLPPLPNGWNELTAGVHAHSVGRWRETGGDLHDLFRRLEPELAQFGYG